MTQVLQSWRSVARGLWVLTHRRVADRELADEMAFFFAAAEAENVRRGLSTDAARRAARLEFGTPDQAREEVRAFGWENLVDSILSDLRYAVRRLRRKPGFTLVSVLTLALGIGASTAIFSAVNSILLRSLPFPEADRLVVLSDRGGDGRLVDATFGTFSELRARARSFESLAALDAWRPTITATHAPERLEGEQVSANYFATLGVTTIKGRDFTVSDDEVGAPRVVIVSDRLALRRFGANGLVVGRSVWLDGGKYEVIGIVPSQASALSRDIDVWSPLRSRVKAPFNAREWGHHYQIVGRLTPRHTAGDARREIEQIGRHPVAEFIRPTWASLDGGLVVRTLRDAVTQDVRPALIAMAGAALLLVAIACVNVAILLIADGARRRAELVMRAALGGAQLRLLRQLFTEGIVHSVIGGAFGFVVALAGVRAFIALSPSGLPRVDAITFDTRVFALACVATILLRLGVGMWPVIGTLRAARTGESQRVSPHIAGTRSPTRRILVVAEVAFALVLLVGAGLLTRSMIRLFASGAGFDPRHVLTLQVGGSGPTFASDSVRLRLYERVLAEVRSVPGVSTAAFTSTLPLMGLGDGYGFQLKSMAATEAGDAGSALRYAVTPGYFAAMGIPLRRGRLLEPTDTAGTDEAIVVSESFARQIFGDADPIGQRIRFGPETGGTRPWDLIVGVVGDVKQHSLALDGNPAFYVATPQWGWVDDVQSLVIRATADDATLARRVKEAIWSIDPDRPVQHVVTMDELIATSASQRRFALIVIGSFAFAALVLVTVGMYGVISLSVTEQRREIGIMKALGASSASISIKFVRSGVVSTAFGIALGLAGAIAASRVLEGLLYDVSPVDPATYTVVCAGLAVVALLASWIPARRAAHIDPCGPLRSE